MKAHLTTSVIGLFALLACRRSTLTREQLAVDVDGTREQWQLEWHAPPTEVCAPGSEEAATCPCTGFAYGEQGTIDLVRHRPGNADERFPLNPLFDADESPADSGVAVLQRWPLLESDLSGRDTAGVVATVHARKPVIIMTPGDYDHDGHATEFLLQVGTAPCGKRESVLVGISKANPHMHAFTSVAHPDRPLLLEAPAWKALLESKGSATAVEWACGDHAAETQAEVRVSATSNGIEGSRDVFECTSTGTPGRLVSSTRI